MVNLQLWSQTALQSITSGQSRSPLPKPQKPLQRPQRTSCFVHSHTCKFGGKKHAICGGRFHIYILPIHNILDLEAYSKNSRAIIPTLGCWRPLIPRPFPRRTGEKRGEEVRDLYFKLSRVILMQPVFIDWHFGTTEDKLKCSDLQTVLQYNRQWGQTLAEKEPYSYPLSHPPTPTRHKNNPKQCLSFKAISMYFVVNKKFFLWKSSTTFPGFPSTGEEGSVEKLLLIAQGF